MTAAVRAGSLQLAVILLLSGCYHSPLKRFTRACRFGRLATKTRIRGQPKATTKAESAIELDLFASFVIFAIIAALTPGPNNVMLTTTGLNFGVRRGMPHLFGVCIGFPVMLALIGLGFGTLFHLFPLLHEAIKIVGIVYLLYLAWKIASAESSSRSATPTKPISFWQSAAFQWINPKAWVMGSSALAAYTSLDDNFFLQVAIICSSFAVITFPCAGAWLVFGAGLQRFLRDPLHRKTFNIVMALLLLASILPVVHELID